MAEDMPLVSIVMNCYNCAVYLREAIESVLAQSYDNWEIIFWDNQSTDESAQIVKSYNDARIKYIYAPSHTPLGEARNYAVEHCSGEWVAFLDCDDYWECDKLEASFQALRNHPKKERIALIYSRSNVVDDTKKVYRRVDRSPNGNIHDLLLKEGDFIMFSSIVVKRDKFEEVGGIDTRLHYCEDYDILLKLTAKYDVIGLDAYLTYYREHSQNTTSRNLGAYHTEILDFLQNYTTKNRVPPSVRGRVYLNNTKRLIELVLNQAMVGTYAQVLEVLVKYRRYLPAMPFVAGYFAIKRVFK
jgi:glycosyltransferase involved in cell wall biosynthesis